ncbi:MAG: hypothetical protein BIP78_0263 [Candidatus Bipolaricaulis sibiricus]|uniref:Uncharacterized protein n=1 Tax=Bipolaricaulis sibiricus TaxID=2501609 RepID=A0A410FST6_BIPS1|nr:MAG: hypothetical protein BIP78_0263 [Candidatus Bipolaricaulis sibiricus]
MATTNRRARSPPGPRRWTRLDGLVAGPQSTRAVGVKLALGRGTVLVAQTGARRPVCRAADLRPPVSQRRRRWPSDPCRRECDVS